MIFRNATEGTIKFKDATSNKIISLPGITSNILTQNGWDVEDCAEYANYLLAIGGLSVVADNNAKFDVTAKAVNS